MLRGRQLPQDRFTQVAGNQRIRPALEKGFDLAQWRRGVATLHQGQFDVGQQRVIGEIGDFTFPTVHRAVRDCLHDVAVMLALVAAIRLGRGIGGEAGEGHAEGDQ